MEEIYKGDECNHADTWYVCKWFPPGAPRLSPESPFGPPSVFHYNIDLGWVSRPLASGDMGTTA